MTKTEACKILQVASSADAEIITQAYWHLARKYRAAAGRDRRAKRRLDELEEAFAVLHPGPAEAPPPQEARVGPGTSGELPLAEEFMAWLRQVAEQTTARWRGRVPEIMALAVATVVLAFLALSAGASPVLTLLALALALVTVVSPWRRT